MQIDFSDIEWYLYVESIIDNSIYETNTNAPSIGKLEGIGYQVGASCVLPEIPVALGGEINMFPDTELNTMYLGKTRSCGVGTPGVEAHVEIGYTDTIDMTVFNIYDVAESYITK